MISKCKNHFKICTCDRVNYHKSIFDMFTHNIPILGEIIHLDCFSSESPRVWSSFMGHFILGCKNHELLSFSSWVPVRMIKFFSFDLKCDMNCISHGFEVRINSSVIRNPQQYSTIEFPSIAPNKTKCIGSTKPILSPFLSLPTK